MASTPFKQLCEDIAEMSKANVLYHVKQAVISLKEAKDLNSKDVYLLLRFLFKTRDDKEVVKEAQKNGMAKLFMTIVQSLENTITSPDEQNQGLLNLKNFLMVFSNYANQCPELGIEFAKYGGVECAISLMKRIMNKESQSRLFELLSKLLDCLYNSVRHEECSVNRSIYRKAGAVEVLKNLLGTSLKTDALLTLSFIINEEESEVLGSDNETVEYLVELLKEAAHSEDRVARMKPYIYDLTEIANGLKQVSVNDANKKFIFKSGGIETLNKMLADEFSSEEHTVAGKLLWSLSFEEGIRKSEIFKESVKALTRLTKSEDRHVSSVCKDALWQITGGGSSDDKKKSEAASSSNENSEQGGHIMISYNWTHQQLALKIRDELEAAGYTVWIDVDKLGGDILESMADAVEKSSLVLLCMTQQYHTSISCRSEATHAYKKQKPIIPLLLDVDYKPQGWLDILIGTRLYYKLFTEEEIKKDMDKLKKAISMHYKSQGVTSEIDGGEPVRSEKSETTTSGKKYDALSWSNERVLEWFDDIELPQLKDVLKSCDGSDLNGIYEDSCRDAAEFKKDCESSFGLEYKEIIHFKSCLKKTFCN